MEYKTTCAILIKGDRVEKGQIVDLSPEEAARLGGDVEAVGGAAPEPEPTPEKPVEEMTAAELKEKAAALGLPTSGTKADLQERIALHVEGGGVEEEEEEVNS